MLDEPDYSKILSVISNCTAPDKLNNFIENAARKNNAMIHEAAIRQLASLVPEHDEGTLEYDFWKTLTTYELVLREDGKSQVRLQKTRTKVKEEGIVITLSDWATQKQHQWVFDHLIQKGMSDLLGESVILRHRSSFDAETLQAAERRLSLAGVTNSSP